MNVQSNLVPGDSVRAVESLTEAFDAGPLVWTNDHLVRVASAEGLILTKIVAFRPQDQLDIDTLLTANRDKINIDFIREEWSPFAATEAELTTWLEAAIDKRIVRCE
jgi:hypothetical protein